jgi:hypothetical protein
MYDLKNGVDVYSLRCLQLKKTTCKAYNIVIAHG